MLIHSQKNFADRLPPLDGKIGRLLDLFSECQNRLFRCDESALVGACSDEANVVVGGLPMDARS